MTDPAATTQAGMLESTLFEVKKVIVGQDRAIERLIVCLLAGGHCLLEGVPGLAKTLAAETLATVVSPFNRLQFTPDLLRPKYGPESTGQQRAVRLELGRVRHLHTGRRDTGPHQVQSACSRHCRASVDRGNTFPCRRSNVWHAEPDRVRGVYPCPSRTRPLPHEDRGRLPTAAKRSRSSTAWALGAGAAADALHRRLRSAAGGRASTSRPSRIRGHARSPRYPEQSRCLTEPLLPRCEPTRQPRSGRRGASPSAGPPLPSAKDSSTGPGLLRHRLVLSYEQWAQAPPRQGPAASYPPCRAANRPAAPTADRSATGPALRPTPTAIGRPLTPVSRVVSPPRTRPPPAPAPTAGDGVAWRDRRPAAITFGAGPPPRAGARRRTPDLSVRGGQLVTAQPPASRSIGAAAARAEERSTRTRSVPAASVGPRADPAAPTTAAISGISAGGETAGRALPRPRPSRP